MDADAMEGRAERKKAIGFLPYLADAVAGFNGSRICHFHSRESC
jgi:hypothetical protein